MNKSIRFFCLSLLLLCSGRAFPTSLELLLDNTLYMREDIIDTSRNSPLYSGGFSADLQKIGSTDLSLSSDVGFANSFLDTSHKQFELRSLFLDAPLVSGLSAKFGRQRIYSLITKSDYIDGLKLDYSIGKKVAVHGLAGMPVPSRYSPEMVQTNTDLIKTEAGADFNVFRTMWVGLQGGRETDSAGTVRTPIDASIDGQINARLGIRSNVGYDATGEEIDNYSAEVTCSPVSALEVKAHVRGETNTIDSTDAYERLFLRKYDESGLQVAARCSRGRARGYFTHRILENGSDDIGGITAAVKGIFLGFEAGDGISGSSTKTTLGISHAFKDEISAGISGSLYIFELPENGSSEQSICAKMYARWYIPSIGITVSPEVQYLKNEYYNNDFRFLFKAQYRFFSFWKS